VANYPFWLKPLAFPQGIHAARARDKPDDNSSGVGQDHRLNEAGRSNDVFKNILVGVDRHQGGRDAVALAKRLLDEGGELTLAHIFSREPHTWPQTEQDRAEPQVRRSNAGSWWRPERERAAGRGNATGRGGAGWASTSNTRLQVLIVRALEPQIPALDRHHTPRGGQFFVVMLTAGRLPGEASGS